MIDCPNGFSIPYCPGYWAQDIFTLPLELGLVASLSQFPTHASKPLGLFSNESTSYPNRKPTRHGPKLLIPAGTILSTGGFALANGLRVQEYRVGEILRGWAHAHLITEIFTLLSKNTFQRKRPFYDNVYKDNPNHIRLSDKQSFFSGHASHAFTFASYGSYFILGITEKDPWAWAYSGLLFGLAAWVAGSRAFDGQHHWSDVMVGASIGATVGLWTSSRALAISKAPRSGFKEDTKKTSWEISYWFSRGGGGIQFGIPF